MAACWRDMDAQLQGRPEPRARRDLAEASACHTASALFLGCTLPSRVLGRLYLEGPQETSALVLAPQGDFCLLIWLCVLGVAYLVLFCSL